MEVGDEGAGVPGGQSALPALLDEGLNPGHGLVEVGLVHAVDPGLLWELHVGVGEEELADGRVVGEAIDAASGGVDHHGGAAVEHVAGGDEVLGGLQEVFHGGRLRQGGPAAVDAEDGADADVDVDVGRAVEGVDADDVFAVSLALPPSAVVDVQDARLLFGHDAAHLEAGPQDAVEGVVGIDVQLLLGFALHVGAAVSIGGVGTQNAREPGAVDVPVDHLRRGPDVGQGGVIGHQWRRRIQPDAPQRILVACSLRSLQRAWHKDTAVRNRLGLCGFNLVRSPCRNLGLDPNFPAMILRNTLVLVFALTVGFPALSQGIYGLKQNVLDPFTEGLLLARFDMELGAWAEYDTLGFAEAFALGSSTFDNVSGQYVFVGAPLGGGPLEWYNYDVEGNALSAGAELADYVHSLHHDMQHNRFFGLQGYAADSVYIDLGEVDGEPFGYWQVDGWATRLVEVAPFTAEIDPLLDLPDVESVIAGASCLDSDSGAYYFLAFGGNGITRLVQLDAEAGTVTSDVEVVLGPDEAFAEIEFCIPTGQVVGLWRDLSEAGVMRLATLDAETGEPTEVVALPQVWGGSRRMGRCLTRTPTAMCCTIMTRMSSRIFWPWMW